LTKFDLPYGGGAELMFFSSIYCK